MRIVEVTVMSVFNCYYCSPLILATRKIGKIDDLIYYQNKNFQEQGTEVFFHVHYCHQKSDLSLMAANDPWKALTHVVCASFHVFDW